MDKLDGKMDEIVDRYNSSINQIIPSTNNILEQNMVSVENGNLIISDCESIPINSLEGIASIEIMDMIANGKSAKEAVEIIEKDINKIFNAQDIMHTKGLYVGV